MRLIASAASWVLALLMAAFLALDALTAKLQNAPGEDAIFSGLAAQSGFALFEPSLRVGFGLLELVIAVLLLMPGSRRLGAWLALLTCGLAMSVHFSPWMGIEAPIAAGGPPADGGALFFFASFLLGLAILLTLVEGQRQRLDALA